MSTQFMNNSSHNYMYTPYITAIIYFLTTHTRNPYYYIHGVLNNIFFTHITVVFKVDTLVQCISWMIKLLTPSIVKLQTVHGNLNNYWDKVKCKIKCIQIQ